eukprot:3164728-Ditylum_brightwellii.AAC.1
MVKQENSVCFHWYKPDYDDVLSATNYGSKNIIYLHPDTNCLPNTIDNDPAAISACAYFPKQTL